ncbi:MAG: mycothiol transferase [Janibacter sp.]
MTSTPGSPPDWEPPLTGTDAEQIVAALDRQRSTFRWKTDGLDVDGLTQRIGASSLTLGGLLNHLAFVEDLYSGHELSGADVDARWHSLQQEGGWTAHFSPDATPHELYALYDDAVSRSRERITEALKQGDLDQATHMGIPEVGEANLRRLLLDLLEEYGRHTGHADLLREAVDGRVGEDPDEDWVSPWSPA